MTTTKSPVSMCGAKIAFRLPRRTVAISLANRPSTLPSASTTHHLRWTSSGFGVKVFISNQFVCLGNSFETYGIGGLWSTRPDKKTGRTPKSPPRFIFLIQCLLLHERFQIAGPAGVTQPNQCLFLDLAYTLACNPQQRSDFFQRHRVLTIVQAEIEAEHFPFALLQRAERLRDRIRQSPIVRLVIRAGRKLVGQIIQQAVVLVWGERRIEREVRLRNGQGAGNFLVRKLQLFGDLFDGRFAAQLLEQGTRAFANAMERAGAVQRDAH